MKKIGLIGGTSPESTLLYYSHLINLSKEKLEKYVYPEIVIYSVNFKKIMELVKSDRKELAGKFSKIFNWMETVGVEVGALTANTLHVVFDMIETNIKLVHIVEAVAEEAKELGYEKLTLFGTYTTMTSDLYPNVMKKYGIEIVVPSDEDKEKIERIIFDELTFGKVKDNIRTQLKNLAEKYLKLSDAIILGCTELPIGFKDIDVPKLDTVYIHAKKIFEKAIEG